MATEALIIEVEGVDALLARLGRATGSIVLRAAMQESCNHVQERLAVYPPQSHRPMQFKSTKQRRFVMMLVRSGQVPYRRIGTLGRRWTSKVTGSGADVEGRVGNSTPYGPYVMGKGTQALYHAGNWPIAETVGRQELPTVVSIFAQAIQAAL